MALIILNIASFSQTITLNARCMMWHVNFVRSKDSQKQLAGTSLSDFIERETASLAGRAILENCAFFDESMKLSSNVSE